MRLVYDNAEIYLRWRAVHYLDPDEAQAEELDERIAAYMSWHRTHSLPKYAQIADEARRRMERHLQPDDLVWGTIPSSGRCEKTCAQQQKARPRCSIG